MLVIKDGLKMFNYNYTLPENNNLARSPDSKVPEEIRRDKRQE